MPKNSIFERRHSCRYEEVLHACKNSTSMVEASKSVNVPYKTFIRIAKRLGCYYPNRSSNGWTVHPNKIPLSEILAGHHPSYQSHKLRLRLLEEGLKLEECEICKLREWNGKKIPLQLDHIDGNNSNHILSNLRVICPNCHSQTSTFSCRKR
jgi:hypothetical protein